MRRTRPSERQREKQRAADAVSPLARSGAAQGRSVSTRSSAPGRVRIVGGAWKRTPIEVPDLPGLRPTPDRVRETVFNWLAHLCPETSVLRGLDLFAGSGALGFELASRGAARVVLVERRGELVARLRALKERLRADQVEIVPGDAMRVAPTLAPGSFDVVFLDPPFEAGLLWPAIDQARTLLAAEGLVYAESADPIDPDVARTHGFQIVRAGQAGRVRFHLLRREAS